MQVVTDEPAAVGRSLDGQSLRRETDDARREVLAELGLDDLPGISVPPSLTDLSAAQLLDVARREGALDGE